jgi:hypothetical protein
MIPYAASGPRPHAGIAFRRIIRGGFLGGNRGESLGGVSGPIAGGQEVGPVGDLLPRLILIPLFRNLFRRMRRARGRSR